MIVVVALVVGLIARFLVMPFTYEYDIYHWATVIQNIDSGNGLYELNGYFYTPVWGYILGAIDAFWNTFLSIDVLGEQFTQLLPVEDMENMNHVATITSPEFNYALKIPLVLVDIIIGAVVYFMALSLTGDRRKAAIGFALWFLCPIAIYMSSVQGTFDNISGLLTLMSVFLVLRRHYFLGGFMLMAGALLKLYPAFALPVMLALIYARSDGIRDVAGGLAAILSGAVVSFLVIMLPTMLDGTFWYAFTFITDRSGGFSGANGAFWLVGIALCVLVVLYFTFCMARNRGGDTDRLFLKCVMLALVGGILANMGPQYPLVVLPLMCVYITAIDRSYFICWLLIGVGCCLQALVLNNYSLLMSVTAYWDWFSFDTILDGLEWTESYVFGGNSFRSLMNSVFSFVALAGLLFAVLFHFEDWIGAKCPRIGSVLNRVRALGPALGGGQNA